MNVFDVHADRAARRVVELVKYGIARMGAYIRRLTFPLYLFPVKLITYSSYYILRFLVLFILAILSILVETFLYQFRSMKNFIKFWILFLIALYLVTSMFVIVDYLRTQYGFAGKFFCSVGTKNRLRSSVVRVVGGYSEGSGFFINKNQVLTNFHVIDGEPSPKIILPDGSFETPVSIVGDSDADLAVLTVSRDHDVLVLPLPTGQFTIYEDEPLFATGYPMGTDIAGEPTIVKGNFIAFRQSRKFPVTYVHTGMDLVEGMSGGPLTDQCGNVVGVNTMSLSGQSFYIDAYNAFLKIPAFSDSNIAKISVDPSASPADAVAAFYTYLKARRMQEGFALLSREYLKKTNITEWTNRFTDILDVEVFVSRPDGNSKDTVFVKFSTKNWVDGEVEFHYYEGTWQMVIEDEVYKMNRSKILEVTEPGWEWFYEEE